jgi:hypothetical protein
MHAKQEIPLEWIRGSVHGHFIDLDTGERCNDFKIKNVTTYAAADSMARLLGGDVRYAPGYMGFIYGDTAAPDASLEQPPRSRVVSMASLSTELVALEDVSSNKGNILISPLSAGPGYDVDGSAANYSGNSVTLTAHSGTRFEYAFPTASAGVYADELADGDYFWQALLLTRLVEGSNVTYLPFARVSLKVGGTFPQKPTNFELALYWSISLF